MLQRLFFISVLLLTLTPGLPLYAAETDAQITITEYELEDYYRHPRMEEEDRLRGRVFKFQPGLEIITNVDDAEIQFFEERIGKTPWEQNNLPPGAYRVLLERTGYESVEFWVDVRSDRRTVALVTMVQPSGEIILNKLPPGATVSIDRVPLENPSAGIPLKAPAGRCSLTVSAFGWETVQTDVEIPSGGILSWVYNGKRTAFAFSSLKIKPPVLPPGDKRGFTFEWNATSGGSADMRIISPDGLDTAVIPFAVTSASGKIKWAPYTGKDGNETLPDGKYQVVVNGTGYDNRAASAESSFILDSRFKREARPLFSPLPGLFYVPGTAMLPKGIWQASTGAGFHLGGGIPVDIGVRFSPASRFEFSGKFKLTARDPFDTTSIGMDFSSSWRILPKGGPFTMNGALLFSYEGYAGDFGRIPVSPWELSLPGLQLSIPMEYNLKNWNFVLTPSVNLSFLGEDDEDWRFTTPARVSETLGAGVYYENGRFLVGCSGAVRGPDFPGGFLDTKYWAALEGRLDLPADASYLALYAGMDSLESDPTLSMGIEFGVIR